MNKELIEKIALEVADTFPGKTISYKNAIEFATRFLARIDAERGKSAVGVVDYSYQTPIAGGKHEGKYETTTATDRRLASGTQLFLSPTPVPEKATLTTAPKCLNTNDKAMWVTGWNDCIAAAQGERK